MLYTATSYLAFLANATNAHGVHSPFVFNYLTKCLYKKSKKTGDKIADLILRTLAYFEFTNLHIEGNVRLQELLESENDTIKSGKFPVDLLYFESVMLLDPEFTFSNVTLHNDSVIVIANIHKHRSLYKTWEKCITHPMITVSIDLFCCGLLFVRKEQVKQHFYIRL